MKKILFSAIAIIIAITATAQDRVMKVYKNGEVTHSISITDIDSIKVEETEKETTGIINGYEWVDLGLPSGLKWATCNVGASNPEGYGNYYAWGETTTKSNYLSSTSTTYGKTMGDISGNATYDAATANWGGSWRLPTRTEIEELVNNCTWAWTTQNGVNGRKVTGPNGNSIFLPAAGYRYGSSLYGAGSLGYCWSSTPDESSTDYAYNLYFDSGYYVWSSNYRNYGQSVRPVTE